MTTFLQEAHEIGCDTYVTGEGSMYTKLFAREIGMNLIFGSHYATEFPGIKAFAQRIAEEFNLSWKAISEDGAIR
jgi:putative NIF3 family GTP cyclohydrolase 1 type 2